MVKIKKQMFVGLENGISINTLIRDDCGGEFFLTYVADGDACYSTIIEIGPYGECLYPEVIDQLAEIFSVPNPYPCKKCTLLNKSLCELTKRNGTLKRG